VGEVGGFGRHRKVHRAHLAPLRDCKGPYTGLSETQPNAPLGFGIASTLSGRASRGLDYGKAGMCGSV